MNIQIHTEHINIGDSQELYIREKLEALSKYYEKAQNDDSILVRVNVERNVSHENKEKIILRVTMSVPQSQFRAEVNSLTVEEGIDLVHDKLNRQIERYKAKHTNHSKITTAEFAQAVAGSSPKIEEFIDGRISKRKLFSDLFPMSEKEAINQMEMLGHTFFIFVNQATDRYNIVYKRPNEDTYGLVELEHQDGILS